MFRRLQDFTKILIAYLYNSWILPPDHSLPPDEMSFSNRHVLESLSAEGSLYFYIADKCSNIIDTVFF